MIHLLYVPKTIYPHIHQVHQKDHKLEQHFQLQSTKKNHIIQNRKYTLNVIISLKEIFLMLYFFT